MKTRQNSDLANTHTIFVILGMTGDLAAKKIIPSLWHLYIHGNLPKNILVIGFSRRLLAKAELKKLLLTSIKQYSGEEVSQASFAKFSTIFRYHSGDFNNQQSFLDLAAKIVAEETRWGVCANKLFYLAVPPIYYEAIFHNLAAAKLNLPCSDTRGWSRLLIEKPFGSDLKSARSLQTLLLTYFKEKQIYRIDHYLFKEIIQGIENFRFSNNLFETTWDNTSISSIEIKLWETIGVENRGSFYDSVGALRDVGQNHLLSMLSAVTMEYPSGVGADEFRKNRAAILASLQPWTAKTLKTETFRSQYEGYQKIKGVKEKSQTETYFALTTRLLHKRWRGVPITMEAGKRLGEARKEIILTFRHPKNCHMCSVRSHAPNRIIFRLAPNDEVIIEFWTKKPGLERVLEKRSFSFFLYEKETEAQYVEEYAKVLYTAMVGDQSLYLLNDEIEAMWKFADPVVAAWKKNLSPLFNYAVDTTPIPELLQSFSGDTLSKEKKHTDVIGIVGLGKMGRGIAEQLLSKNWQVAGFNRSPEVTRQLEALGLIGADSLESLVHGLPQPRTIWLMVPYQSVDNVLDELLPLLSRGDTIIDGGNSPFEKSMQRAKRLQKKHIQFLDVGVSGGPNGARRGACLMIGGDRSVFNNYEGLFKTIAVDNGYKYVGKSGAGHFVKMVHNGIEYGMMQAIGEGFAVMNKSDFALDLSGIASLYNHGSVITSRLVGWLVEAYEEFGEGLANDECCSATVAHSGEAEWTIAVAKRLGVPVRVIEEALEFRRQSAKNPSYTGRVVSALRHQFGGHQTAPLPG